MIEKIRPLTSCVSPGGEGHGLYYMEGYKEMYT